MIFLKMRAIVLIALFFYAGLLIGQTSERIRIGLTGYDRNGLNVYGPSVGLVLNSTTSSQQIFTLMGFDFDVNKSSQFDQFLVSSGLSYQYELLLLPNSKIHPSIGGIITGMWSYANTEPKFKFI